MSGSDFLTQDLNVQGIAKVTDFAQSFYYLACSICKRATMHTEMETFGATAVPKKIKFNIQITNETGSIEAVVFSEVAAEAYGITPADAIDEKLALPVLHKLGEPGKCIMTLKVYMHNCEGQPNKVQRGLHVCRRLAKTNKPLRRTSCSASKHSKYKKQERRA